MSVKSLSIRIDKEMLDKLHYAADYEARSASGQYPSDPSSESSSSIQLCTFTVL